MTTAYWAEAQRQSAARRESISTPALMQSGGNMEGKEVRFGIANSALFATVTTDASCGAVNGWHDSFTPLGGLVPLVNIMLSEVVFGGVGAGLYGMLIFVVLAVFIAGLMVGRTPEYLGKKIEAYDVKMAMLVTLVFPLVILVLAGISSVERIRHFQHQQSWPARTYADSLRLHLGPGNNGSAFGGLNANTPWYNIARRDDHAGRPLLHDHSRCWRSPATWPGRSIVPPSLGTFPVTTPLFSVLLVGVILIVGALTFFPGAEPRTDPRAPADACRKDFLRMHMDMSDKESKVDLGREDRARARSGFVASS